MTDCIPNGGKCFRNTKDSFRTGPIDFRTGVIIVVIVVVIAILIVTVRRSGGINGLQSVGFRFMEETCQRIVVDVLLEHSAPPDFSLLEPLPSPKPPRHATSTTP